MMKRLMNLVIRFVKVLVDLFPLYEKYCSEVAKLDELGFDVFCDICKNVGVKPVTKYSMKKGM